jgi:hypothetical protein
LVSHLNIFPIGSNVNLSCGGGHLGFLIGIKNLKLKLETELRRNVFGASGERYRLLRASGSFNYSFVYKMNLKKAY